MIGDMALPRTVKTLCGPSKVSLMEANEARKIGIPFSADADAAILNVAMGDVRVAFPWEMASMTDP